MQRQRHFLLLLATILLSVFFLNNTFGQQKQKQAFTPSQEHIDITNTHIPDSVLIKVSKYWDDHNNNDGFRPSSITVNLLANGDSVDTRTITGEGHEWETSFGKWPVKSNGDSIEYSLAEVWVPGYQAPSVVHLNTATEGVYKLQITNVHKLDSINLKVVKVWNDFGNSNGRNDVHLQLYRCYDNTAFNPDYIDAQWIAVGDPKTLGSDVDTIPVTWNRMPQFYKGKTVRYAVKELDSPDGYSAFYTFGGELRETNDYTDTIFNSRISPINITVEKVWNDFNNALNTRPEQIIVHLMANSTDTAQTTTLTANNGWSFTFQNLPDISPSGLIDYSIVEENIPHYEGNSLGDKTKGFTILNTLVSYGEDSDCTNSVSRDQLSECPDIDCTPVTDNGITYNVVKIDGFCWMAENLRKQTPDAMVYQSVLTPNTEENLATYGYLYTWHDAVGGTNTPERVNGYIKGICPNGWHLPTEAEISVLTTNTMSELSNDSLWVKAFGTNSTGFNALPAGIYNATANRFEGIRSEAVFMGDTQNTSFRFEHSCCRITNNVNIQNNGASIRCVKDCQ